MRDSVKSYFKMFGNRDIEGFMHGYLYARYINAYIYRLGKLANLVDREAPHDMPPELEDIMNVLVGKVARETLNPDTSSYHGKVMLVEHAVDLVSVGEDVFMPGQEHIIPYPIANDIILENPDHIAVFECPCRLTQNDPCMPLDVCMAVGEPFVSFLEEFDINGIRRITQEEAAKIVREEHERGHVHTAYFKDAAGGRFFAICNCCPCCCIGMKAHRAFGPTNISSSGFTARVDRDECNGCGNCEEACPFDAVKVGDEMVAYVEADKCFGCGVCEARCELQAITLEPDPSRPAPLDIKSLIERSK
jgi:NAD-dependent dihydropyrimidine dehydrogenase PreA subunit